MYSLIIYNVFDDNTIVVANKTFTPTHILTKLTKLLLKKKHSSISKLHDNIIAL